MVGICECSDHGDKYELSLWFCGLIDKFIYDIWQYGR